MKVMLIGGTGVLSKDIAKKCLESKFELYMINRGNKLEYAPEGAHIIIGDIKNVLKLKKKLKEIEFDVVVDFLSYTPEQLANTLELFRDKCKQYIFISSATAYSKKYPEKYIEEEMNLDNFDWSYSENKILCERLLEIEYKKRGLQYTIVRPYITYGDTRIPFAFISKEHQWTLVDRILNDKPIVVWDEGEAICTLTHTEDFAKGVVGLFGNPKAFREAFHITSDENLSWTQVLEKIGEAIGKRVNIVHVPSEIIEKNFKEMKGELLGDKSITRRFNNNKIKSCVTEFNCEIKFSEGIKRTLEYYKEKPALIRVDNEWNAKVDMLIYKYCEKKHNNLKFKHSLGNNILFLKNLFLVQYYNIFNKFKWLVKGLSVRAKRATLDLVYRFKEN